MLNLVLMHITHADRADKYISIPQPQGKHDKNMATPYCAPNGPESLFGVRMVAVGYALPTGWPRAIAPYIFSANLTTKPHPTFLAQGQWLA